MDNVAVGVKFANAIASCIDKNDSRVLEKIEKKLDFFTFIKQDNQLVKVISEVSEFLKDNWSEDLVKGFSSRHVELDEGVIYVYDSKNNFLLSFDKSGIIDFGGFVRDYHLVQGWEAATSVNVIKALRGVKFVFKEKARELLDSLKATYLKR